LTGRDDVLSGERDEVFHSWQLSPTSWLVTFPLMLCDCVNAFSTFNLCVVSYFATYARACSCARSRVRTIPRISDKFCWRNPIQGTGRYISFPFESWLDHVSFVVVIVRIQPWRFFKTPLALDDFWDASLDVVLGWHFVPPVSTSLFPTLRLFPPPCSIDFIPVLRLSGSILGSFFSLLRGMCACLRARARVCANLTAVFSARARVRPVRRRVVRSGSLLPPVEERLKRVAIKDYKFGFTKK